MTEKILDSDNIEIAVLKDKIRELEERIAMLESKKTYPRDWIGSRLPEDYFLDGCSDEERERLTKESLKRT